MAALVLTGVLGVLAVLAAITGVYVFANAKSAIHEIEALIAFLLFAVAASGAFVVQAVRAIRDDVAKLPVRMAAPRICDGCGAEYRTGGGTVRAGGETKHVCSDCAEALIDDAKAAAAD